MLEFFLSLFEGVVGLMAILGLWYVVQAYVRYKSGCGRDRDLLEFMAHGCASCRGPGSCSTVSALQDALPSRDTVLPSRDHRERSLEEHHHELV